MEGRLETGEELWNSLRECGIIKDMDDPADISRIDELCEELGISHRALAEFCVVYALENKSSPALVGAVLLMGAALARRGYIPNQPTPVI